MKKNMGRYITVFVIAAVIIWGVFYYVNNRDTDGVFEKNQKPNTEVESIINLNLDTYYPATPRDVVRTYARIQKAFYNEPYNEESFEAMLDQMRKLFDFDFLAINPRETQKTALYDDIKLSKDKKRRINSYTAQKERETEYWTKDGEEYASIIIYFSVRRDDGFESTYEKFLFKRDREKNWKILGWQLTEPVNIGAN